MLFLIREDSKRSAEEVQSEGELERSLHWKFHRKKRDTVEQHVSCRHTAVNGDTTHKSHSQGLEETPVSKNELRTECSSSCH